MYQYCVICKNSSTPVFYYWYQIKIVSIINLSNGDNIPTRQVFSIKNSRQSM